MIRSERIAKKINEYIEALGNSRAKLVIGIEGYAGSGKTTVADFIAKQNKDVLCIHLDDFIRHWKDRKQMIEKAEDKSKVFEYEWYRYDDLEMLILAFVSGKEKAIKFRTYDYEKNDFGPEKEFDLTKNILVIDGIFLFHSSHRLNQFIDVRVYLDVNFERADKLRISREKKRWGKDYIPENHPDNWTKYFKEAYRRYVIEQEPGDKSDMVFNLSCNLKI